MFISLEKNGVCDQGDYTLHFITEWSHLRNTEEY